MDMSCLAMVALLVLWHVASRRRGQAADRQVPAAYPDWIPVDERLAPLGREVRTMTHLHGGFVAASDGNPVVERAYRKPVCGRVGLNLPVGGFRPGRGRRR
jgi:hypothetical protein